MLTKETRIYNETTVQTHIQIIPQLNFILHTVRVTRVVVIVVAIGDHCCWTSWLSTFVVISVCFSYALFKRSDHCCCLLVTVTVELLTINFCRPQVVLVETICCEWVAELEKKNMDISVNWLLVRQVFLVTDHRLPHLYAYELFIIKYNCRNYLSLNTTVGCLLHARSDAFNVFRMEVLVYMPTLVCFVFVSCFVLFCFVSVSAFCFLCYYYFFVCVCFSFRFLLLIVVCLFFVCLCALKWYWWKP